MLHWACQPSGQLFVVRWIWFIDIRLKINAPLLQKLSLFVNTLHYFILNNNFTNSSVSFSCFVLFLYLLPLYLSELFGPGRRRGEIRTLYMCTLFPTDFGLYLKRNNGLPNTRLNKLFHKSFLEMINVQR